VAGTRCWPNKKAAVPVVGIRGLEACSERWLWRSPGGRTQRHTDAGVLDLGIDLSSGERGEDRSLHPLVHAVNSHTPGLEGRVTSRKRRDATRREHGRTRACGGPSQGTDVVTHVAAPPLSSEGPLHPEGARHVLARSVRSPPRRGQRIFHLRFLIFLRVAARPHKEAPSRRTRRSASWPLRRWGSAPLRRRQRASSRSFHASRCR
jgi:hypothetical protein